METKVNDGGKDLAAEVALYRVLRGILCGVLPQPGLSLLVRSVTVSVLATSVDVGIV